MSIKYLAQLTRDEIAEFADIFEKGDMTSVEVGEVKDDAIMITTHARLGRYLGVVNAFKLDDYSIIAYDFWLPSESVFDYRKRMLDRFGSEYAEDFLLTHLGTDLQ